MEAEENTIKCICSECAGEFLLTADTDGGPDSPGKTCIRISACESGGVYGVKVRCPLCGYEHLLY